MTAQASYDELTTTLQSLSDLGSVFALLGWDEMVKMPTSAAPARGRQKAAIAKLLHERRIDPKLGDLIGELEGQAEQLDLKQNAVVRETRAAYDRHANVPPELVAQLTEHRTESIQVWAKARKANDFASFAPMLEKSIELVREVTDARGADDATRYSILLDDFDPGLTEDAVAELFTNLRDKQAALLRKIVAAPKQPKLNLADHEWDIDRQADVGREFIRAFGYDIDRGRLDVSLHPFCSGINQGDVRITTRYATRDPLSSVMGTMHEAGHAMYEQGLPAETWGTPLSQANGMALHESQSRMWENLVGRSRPFWSWAWPKMQDAFARQLSSANADDWYHAVNTVRPGLIRVEADEVSYNLHIIVRFELERKLIRKQLPVAELPGEWKRLYSELIGVEVPDDKDGCLQDVHWPGGMFGYFPSYAIGNLYSAQLFAACHREVPGVEDGFAEGRFEPLLAWLREKVHTQGRTYQPRELMEKVTGKPPTADDYLAYLEGKFLPLYGAN